MKVEPSGSNFAACLGCEDCACQSTGTIKVTGDCACAVVAPEGITINHQPSTQITSTITFE